MAGLMGEPGGAGHIADCENARNRGAAIGIGYDMAAINSNAHIFQAQIFNISQNPNRRNDRVKRLGGGFTGLFNMRRHFALCPVELFDHCLLQNMHTLFFKLFFGKSTYFSIFYGQDPIHHLYNGGIRTQRVVKTSKFNSNRARPNNQ